MKLGLGTVQFGINYGISNPAGKTTEKEVSKILAVAKQNSIRIIDTAPLYGNSEEVLGKEVKAENQFKLVTKTARFDTDRVTPTDASLLEQTFLRSLKKLQCPSVYGLIIHNAADVLARDGYRLMDRLTILKRRGLVKKLGVSVYTAKQIEMVLDRFEIDLIQLPINVLDQRLLHGGQLAMLKDAGVEIHARSVFLQGLLLMPLSLLPSHFNSIKRHLRHYREYLSQQGLTPIQAALGFVIGLKEIDAVICGVNNHQQLEELCAVKILPPETDFCDFALDDDLILNPSKWQTSRLG